MITANNLAANALEKFDNGVDDDNGVDVTFDDAVNAQAYNAASGVTTSGTSVDFANFALHANQTLLGATNARGVGREQRGNLRGGCMSKLCVE